MVCLAPGWRVSGGRGSCGGGGIHLVAADFLGHVVQSLDDSQAEFFALLVFEHRDVFDVADESQVVDARERDAESAQANQQARPPSGGHSSPSFPKPTTTPTIQWRLNPTTRNKHSQLPLDHHPPRPHHLPLPITNNKQKILVPPPAHPVVALIPRRLAHLPHRRQHPQHVQVSAVVVGPLQRPDRVRGGQRGGHGGGDERGREDGGGVRRGGPKGGWGLGGRGGPHCGWPGGRTAGELGGRAV